MKRKLIITADGSSSIHLPDWDEQYHSKHGAIQEAKHVFIKMGLDYLLAQENNSTSIPIIEIGFGTGLNALLTAIAADLKNITIDYTGVEAYPVEKEEVKLLNYPAQLQQRQAADYFKNIHAANWEEQTVISSNFKLIKKNRFFNEITDQNKYQLIYFDAFGPRVQPDLWGEDIFKIMFTALKKGGVLVTYSAKGSARRAMQKVGFAVEKIPGPPGKREMLRAVK